MKTALIVLVLLAVLVLAVPACSSWGGKAPAAGLVDNRLRPCPDSPNCVCSEFADKRAFIPPLDFQAGAGAAWQALRRAVVDAGGAVRTERDDYLHAVFTTPVLRFADDVEFRLARVEGVIHVRSASRVGYSDFGVNRRRVERLRARYRDYLNERPAGQ